jgi:hypothetical protein
MLPKKHFLYGAIVAVFLFFVPFVNFWESLVFLVSTVLIDVDHYFYYVSKKRKYDIKGAYRWFKAKEKLWKALQPHDRKHYYTGFYLFHGIEWLIIFFLLGYFCNSIFYFIFLGMLFHLILDWVMQERYSYPYRFKFSVIYDYFKFKKLRLIE